LRIARTDQDHPEIAFFSANHTVKEIVEGLILIYEVLTPAEMTGHVEHI
jgi:hypothetical protein